jgi:hypothetical protein
VEKAIALEVGTQKAVGKIRISGRIRTLFYSQSDFRGKNSLFGLFFLT